MLFTPFLFEDLTTILLYFMSIKVSNEAEYGTTLGLLFSSEKISATEWTNCKSICPAACTKWVVVDSGVWENDSTATVDCAGIDSKRQYCNQLAHYYLVYYSNNIFLHYN